MYGFPHPGPWPAIRKDLLKAGRKPVVAAVAYIGVDAPQVMPLRRGDILVCDASEPAVRGRLTSATALATFHRRGVAVFNLEDLHAKVIASNTYAWIGSANASTNSEKELVEASTRVTGPSARRLQKWTSSLATEDRSVSAADIRRLEAIKLDPPRRGTRKTTVPTSLPLDLPRLRFVETEAITSKADEKATELDRSNAKKAARASGLPSSLESIIWAGGSPAKAGDWVIDIRSNRVRPPAVVVRVGHHQRGDIIWLSPVKTANRPKIAALRQAVPELASGFGTRLVRSQRAVEEVIALFR